VAARQLAKAEDGGEVDLDDVRPVLFRKLGRGRAPDDSRMRGALLTLIIGSICGSILGYDYIKATGKDASTYELPFGTFLGAAALAAAIAGPKVLGWYGGL
jgi:hypothetical protein